MIRNTNTECLHPMCGKVRVTKGLCPAHYQMARRLVMNRSNPITWAMLVEEGRALAKKDNGNASIDQVWFTEVLHKYRVKLVKKPKFEMVEEEPSASKDRIIVDCTEDEDSQWT